MALEQLMDRPHSSPVRPAHLPKVIFQLGLDGTFRYVSDSFCLVFGYIAEEIKGVFASGLLRPDETVRDVEPANWALYDEVARGRRDSCEFDTRLRARDGHYVHVRIHATLIRQHGFVQIEAEVLSNELVLWRMTQPQFANPFERMEMDAWLESQRASNGLQVEETLHKPQPPFDDPQYFIDRLQFAIKKCKDLWHPTIDEVCEWLPEDSAKKLAANTLKNYLLWHRLLRHSSVARTLKEIAEDMGLIGERFDE